MEDVPKSENSSDISLKDHLKPYLQNWYLFLIGIVIALTIAFIYLRYTIPFYQTQATVIIKDDGANNLGGINPFSEITGFTGIQNRIENELAIFRSKRLVSDAVRQLKLHIKYENIGAIITSEIYREKPFVVQYLSFNDSLETPRVPKLFIKILSRSELEIGVGNASTSTKYGFGEQISLPFGDITVIPVFNNSTPFDIFIDKNFSVTYNQIESVALSYQNTVKVENEIRFSNVVQLKMNSPVPSKSEDFLNELIAQYNKDATKDRNQVARKTSNFIDSRLEIITKELDSVERNKEVFKSNNRLTNIEAEAQLYLENASEFEKKQLGVGTQLELANTMVDYMKNATQNDLLPANIGIEGKEIVTNVNNYNQLILERNRLLKTSTAKNPVVVNINNQINQIRESILSSLENTRNQLKVRLRDLNYQESALNSKLSQVPTQEKLYRGIERQQTIKEQLYLFLLQQREEASIALAVTASKAKVVDQAYSSKTPVSPKKMLIYLGALIAGILFPFLLIYVYTLLNTKVRNRVDVERALPNVEFIGEIPKLAKGEDELVQVNDRSILAESFRIMRTNIQYNFFKDTDQINGKRIFVTSTIKGEGKTFVAFNLALTIALTGKKVVLVGADIRNPQLHRYLPENVRSIQGLTEYIADETVDINNLSVQSQINSNLDIILSGAIPPNPAELLMLARTDSFFKELDSKYDYIIVDTAPSMLVTDTILINKFADIMLYVIRAGVTEKRLLKFLSDSIANGRLSNVAAVLNDVSYNNFGYGNKYGYTYQKEKKSWYSRWTH